MESKNLIGGHYNRIFGDNLMFIAMNRFLIKNGKEELFEEIWRSRDTYLSEFPGFIEFNLLKGECVDGTTLFASHTKWSSRQDFENWTRCDAFKKAHKSANNNNNKDLYLGHPKFEGFEAVL